MNIIEAVRRCCRSILLFYTTIFVLADVTADGFLAAHGFLFSDHPQHFRHSYQHHIHPKILIRNNARRSISHTGSSISSIATLFSTVDSYQDRLVRTITLPAYYELAKGIDSYQYPTLLHSIHVCSVLTQEMAARCLAIATEHAKRTGCWDRPDNARHATYATCDFAVEECPELVKYLNGDNDESLDFHGRILKDLSQLFDVPVKHMEYLDFFCAHYQAINSEADAVAGIMDRLEAHRDGSLLSYTVTLSPRNDFTGGGTFFDALRSSSSPLLGEGVVRPLPGEAVLHCGKVLHGADIVTSGERTVLVGFVDVRSIRPKVLSRACKEWGRMDEAKRRRDRQRRRKDIPMALNRWLPSSISVIRRGLTPSFHTVENRADTEFQRIRKLKTEDLFLRTALLKESDADL